mgnify:CR=1 FL=1
MMVRRCLLTALMFAFAHLGGGHDEISETYARVQVPHSQRASPPV